MNSQQLQTQQDNFKYLIKEGKLSEFDARTIAIGISQLNPDSKITSLNIVRHPQRIAVAFDTDDGKHYARTIVPNMPLLF